MIVWLIVGSYLSAVLVNAGVQCAFFLRGDTLPLWSVLTTVGLVVASVQLARLPIMNQ